MRQSTSYHREKEQVQQPIKQKKEEEVKVKAGLMSFFSSICGAAWLLVGHPVQTGICNSHMGHAETQLCADVLILRLLDTTLKPVKRGSV